MKVLRQLVRWLHDQRTAVKLIWAWGNLGKLMERFVVSVLTLIPTLLSLDQVYVAVGRLDEFKSLRLAAIMFVFHLASAVIVLAVYTAIMFLVWPEDE